MLDTLPCGSLNITKPKTMLLLLGTTNNCSASILNKSPAAIIIYNHTGYVLEAVKIIFFKYDFFIKTFSWLPRCFGGTMKFNSYFHFFLNTNKRSLHGLRH